MAKLIRKYTTELFLAEAHRIHDNTYTYPNLSCNGSNEKVTIVCSIHGSFTMRARNHITGKKSGCSKCSNKAMGQRYRKTTKQFITEAKEVHKNADYDYSLVDYTTNITPVTIICPTHGQFTQNPSGHLQGKGCQSCANITIGVKNSSTREEFIKKAIAIYGNKYGYDNAVYNGSLSKVRILCPEHGYFSQSPNTHLSGKQCPDCGNEIRIEKLTKGLDQFLNEALEFHGNKYGYDLTIYKHSDKAVTITCFDHGDFEVTPHSHLRGAGCNICRYINQGNLLRMTTNEFIRLAQKEHDDFYTYDKVKLSSSRDSVTITCPKHGDFTQRARNHLYGHGCPDCAKITSSLHHMGPADSDKPTSLYYAQLNKGEEEFYKVGLTVRNTNLRFLAFERYGYKVTLLDQYKDTFFNIIEMEAMILSTMKNYKYTPKILINGAKMGGHTECFNRPLTRTLTDFQLD